MPAYEQRAARSTRAVGAHPPGGAGRPARARSQGGGIGGDGPAGAGAAATGLAPRVAPPVERSAAGGGETAAAVAPGHGGAGARGRTVLGVVGDGSLACVCLVSPLAAAGGGAHLLRHIDAMMARSGLPIAGW